MKNRNDYTKLLEEEARLIAQIDKSKSTIDEEFGEMMGLKPLFTFLKEKIQDKVKENIQTEITLKDSLINLSLDYAYSKITEKLSTDPEMKEEGLTTLIKSIIKNVLDTYYVGYKPIITDKISELVEEGIEKFMKK